MLYALITDIVSIQFKVNFSCLKNSLFCSIIFNYVVVTNTNGQYQLNLIETNEKKMCLYLLCRKININLISHSDNSVSYVQILTSYFK